MLRAEGSRVQGRGSRVSGLRMKGSGAWDLGLRALIQHSGFRFQVSGFGFRIWNLDLGLGLRV